MTDKAVLDTQRWMWSIGDYSAVARHLLPASIDLVEATGIGRGDRVLDVGVGDGNTAIEAAGRGAEVVGVDLTPGQLDLARERASAAGLTIELREGNAEALPFPDDAFDAVVSVFGMIFAPDHERAASELARVCRPGGMVAMTAWVRDHGWYPLWVERAGALLPSPPPGGPNPDAWGDSAEVERRLAAAGLDVEVERRAVTWSFPSSATAAEFFLRAAGPFIAFREAATAAGHGDEVGPALLDVMDASNEATDGTLLMTSAYLLALCRKPR